MLFRSIPQRSCTQTPVVLATAALCKANQICISTVHGRLSKEQRVQPGASSQPYCVLYHRQPTHLATKKIKCFSDNSSVSTIINCGSTKPDLQSVALELFNVCKKHDIVLLPQWLPRRENQIADKISKTIDYDDWYIEDFREPQTTVKAVIIESETEQRMLQEIAWRGKEWRDD